MNAQVKRPPWLRWVAVAVVATVVVIVVGLVIIRLVQGGSEPRLTLPRVTTTTAPPGVTATTGSTGASDAPSGAVALDGSWNASSGSTAGYRVKETLFGQSNTATGRTTAVTGGITVAGTTVSNGSFGVDLTRVTSDRSQRDSQFQGRIMDTATFPTAKFVLTKPIQLNTLPANGVQVTESATGDLTMHGVTQSVTFQVTAQRNASSIQVVGSIPITFADWNIANPSGGPASTGDTGTLEFLLNLSRT